MRDLIIHPKTNSLQLKPFLSSCSLAFSAILSPSQLRKIYELIYVALSNPVVISHLNHWFSWQSLVNFYRISNAKMDQGYPGNHYLIHTKQTTSGTEKEFKKKHLKKQGVSTVHHFFRGYNPSDIIGATGGWGSKWFSMSGWNREVPLLSCCGLQKGSAPLFLVNTVDRRNPANHLASTIPCNKTGYLPYQLVSRISSTIPWVVEVVLFFRLLLYRSFCHFHDFGKGK